MNYIMICIDSLRQDHIGAYGGVAQTPNMDSFAEKSAVFSRLRSEALPTVPVRRSLCTANRIFPWEGVIQPKGLYVNHSGWRPLRERDLTLAEHLQQRGYVTGMVVDVYHLMKPTMNFHRGMSAFEFIRGQENDRWKSAPLAPEDYEHYLPEGKTPGPGFRQYLQNQAGRKGEQDHQCARVFRAAMDWLEGNADHDKFFLWVDSFDPHEPWDTPRKYVDMYDPGWEGREWIDPHSVAYHDMTPEQIEHTKALYKAEVTLVDHWLGKFLDKIEELDLYDDTAVILLSDHGKIVGEFDHFGMSNKTSSRFLYDVPLMVRHPEGLGAGRRIDEWVYTIDITATALDILGEDPLPQTDGQSFLPMIAGEDQRLHDCAITAFSEVWCVWQDEYVYIQDQKLMTERLYNVIEDKHQTQDLSQDLPELKSEMKETLMELVRKGPH
ncbi:MAG: sulfatase [Armatimonadota bacterium]